MPKSIRQKFEIQEDRLAREHDKGLAKPHPETVRPPSEELGSSVETTQIADVSPSEVAQRTVKKKEGSGKDKSREPTANEDTENRLGSASEEEGSKDW
jgi:hypothetical protein